MPLVRWLLACCFFCYLVFVSFSQFLRVLARWFLHVRFQVALFNNCVFRGGCDNFWCPKLSFGRVGASMLVAWGSVLAPWGPWEQQKGLRSQIVIDFAWISGPRFESCPGTLEHHVCVFCYFCFQGFGALSFDLPSPLHPFC